jgi:DNA-directed RNA polymerase specialized sigma24 family protein
MGSPGSMTRCAENLSSPDPKVRDEAALQIWEHYATRLVVLVRRNLDARIRQRTGESDVLQSMYRAFCATRRDDERSLRTRDDLWRLLVHITMCKVRNTAKYHKAARRDYRREAGEVGSISAATIEPMHLSGPSPEEAAILEEEMRQWLEPLSEEQRQLALWKLDGYTNKEISGMLTRTERAVEMKLQVIRAKLERRFEGPDSAEPE